MTSTLWIIQAIDVNGGAHKYDDSHIPYDTPLYPYDGTGRTMFWDQISGY